MRISEFIEADLRAGLLKTGVLPARPTLAALADHYRVSVTPVRAAVDHLVRDQLLHKLANGRLSVNGNFVGNGARRRVRDPEPPRDWDGVLLQDLLRMSLQGDHGYLREEATAARYGIGRTVLRQVLHRLAGAGVVEYVPRCGWRVPAFRYEDMCDYLVVREVLELRALDLARGQLDPGDLKSMLQGNQADRLDNRVHGYLIRKSGNRFLREFFSRPVALYYMALFEHAAPEAAVAAQMARQHRRLLRALIAGDWELARDSLSRHIRAQRLVVKHLMARLQGRARGAGVRRV